MQLPNKLYSYQNSTLFLIPKVLDELKYGPKKVIELYDSIRPFLKDPVDFLSAMDCLYALNAIDLDYDGEVYKCL